VSVKKIVEMIAVSSNAETLWWDMPPKEISQLDFSVWIHPSGRTAD
jgi:hypothetical protein